MRSEWNQETVLRDKYQIYNEGRDRLFYLSSRIYLYFLELCWSYVLQLFNYWLDCKEGIIFFFGVYMNNYLLTFFITETNTCCKEGYSVPQTKTADWNAFQWYKKRTSWQPFPEFSQRIRYGTFAFQGARCKSTAFNLDWSKFPCYHQHNSHLRKYFCLLRSLWKPKTSFACQYVCCSVSCQRYSNIGLLYASFSGRSHSRPMDFRDQCLSTPGFCNVYVFIGLSKYNGGYCS